MRKVIVSLAALIILVLGFGCSRESGPVIMSVNGPIAAHKMGTTLTHEHVLVDFIGADSTGYHRWDKQEAANRILPFLEEIKDLGIHSLIECTPAYLGRDPLLLQELSRKSGMHLITNTGYYGARSNKFIPADLLEKSITELADSWVDEFEQGIEGTGIRPGFIKIAVDRNDTLSETHVKIVSAAALAHNRTGLTIASHTGPDGPAFEQIRILKSYGVDPSNFIWVHAQNGTLEGNIRAARDGAWISLDNVNGTHGRKPEEKFSINWYAERILSLKEAGLLHRVLISHDAGWYSPGEEDGGTYRGYTDILNHLIPALVEEGFTEEDIDQLLIHNPKDAFSFDQT